MWNKMSDSTPIILLAATVAWVSLVTVEFYEKIYRPKIDANLGKLQELGKAQLQELLKDIETKITKGQSDINVLEGRAGVVASILNADNELIKARKTIFLLLFVACTLDMAASYAPGLEISNVISLTSIAYIVSGAVFLGGFWILKKIFWFDNQLLVIARTKGERPAGRKIDYSHLLAVYFSNDATRLNPKGNRLLVNTRTNHGYYMNSLVDAFVFLNGIRWERHPDISQEDWCAKNDVTLVGDTPREDNLV
jgi:hypothetical protein